MYLAFFGVASGGPAHKPSTPVAKIINLGYAFFILLVISAYTANLASILVSSSLPFEVRSMEDAISGGGQVCVLEPTQSTMVTLFPELKLGRTVPLGSFEDVFEVLFKYIGSKQTEAWNENYGTTTDDYCTTSSLAFKNRAS
jgi:hypothetical protein